MPPPKDVLLPTRLVDDLAMGTKETDGVLVVTVFRCEIVHIFGSQSLGEVFGVVVVGGNLWS